MTEPQSSLLSPWKEPYSSDRLVREFAPGHELYGKPAKAMAAACDRDDEWIDFMKADHEDYAFSAL